MKFALYVVLCQNSWQNKSRKDVYKIILKIGSDFSKEFF